MRRLLVTRPRFALKQPFRISRGTRTHAETLVAAISEGGVTGRGECTPYPRYGESADSVAGQIAGVAGAIEAGLEREELLGSLPAGAARNALDCALWDLALKQGRALLPEARPVRTVFTLSVNSPDAMAEAARAAAAAGYATLKLKLAGAGDIERVAAVRAAVPALALVADANEAWSPEQLAPFLDALARLGVAMVEQPLPAAADSALEGFSSPIPLCADESFHTRDSLPGLAGKYAMVNIKLDKAGGLTEALGLRRAAQAAGFEVMVGCMIASSLAIAPAFHLAQGLALADLDAPLLLAEDVDPPLPFAPGGIALPPPRGLWG